LAADYLRKAGTSAYLTNARAKQLAEDEETMARMKEQRAAQSSRSGSSLK